MPSTQHAAAPPVGEGRLFMLCWMEEDGDGDFGGVVRLLNAIAVIGGEVWGRAVLWGRHACVEAEGQMGDVEEPSGGTAARTSVGPGGHTLPGATAGPTENSDVVARSILSCSLLAAGPPVVTTQPRLGIHGRCLQPRRIPQEERFACSFVGGGRLGLLGLDRTAGGDVETARLHSGRTAPPCHTSRE